MAASYVFIGGQTGTETGNKSQRLLDEDETVVWSADHGARVWAVAVKGESFCIAGDRTSSLTTRKYGSAGGTPTWSVDHGATVYAIAVDSAGNVYTGGARTGNLTTRKYNSAGTLQWSVDHGETVYAIAVDASGNVYTGGLPVSNVKIRKYDSSGTLDTGWNLEWATGGGYAEQVTGLCTDASYLYATKYRGSSNLQTIRKYRLSDAGVEWSKEIELVMVGVAVDSSGNVYICGEKNFGSNHLFKLNSSGTTTWSKNPGGTGALGTGVGVDAAGNVYATANNGLYKYNSSGTAQWDYDHGWSLYSVSVAPAALVTSIPALGLPIALGTPWQTLFDVAPGLSLPIFLAVPTSVGGIAPDFADLAATVETLASLDPVTWGPYTGMTSATLATLAIPFYTGVAVGSDSSMIAFAVFSIQCRRRINESSWVSVAVPYSATRYASLLAKVNGELLIDAGFRLPGGPSSKGLFLRMTLTAVDNEEQVHHGQITLTGRVINPPFTATTRTLTGINRIRTDSERWVVTCNVDPLLRPNDTAVAGAESFTVGGIDYRIDPWTATMTVTEALE